MKNKKILYLLITIITIFSFSLNVNAAQELTCTYTEPWWGRGYKISFTQDSYGVKTVYQNQNTDATTKDSGWEKTKFTVEYDGNLDSCPKSYGFEAGRISVSDKGSSFLSGRRSLDSNDSYRHIVDFKLTEGGKVEDTDDNFLNDETKPGTDSKYTGTCTYLDPDGGKHKIQIDYSNKDILVTEFDPEKGKNGEYSNIYHTTVEDEYNIYSYLEYTFKIDSNVTIERFLEIGDGNCPMGIKVNRDSGTLLVGGFDSGQSMYRIYTTVYLEGNEGKTYFWDEEGQRGKNPITGEELSGSDIDDPQFIDIEVENCEDLLGKDIAGYFKIVWNLIKIGIPIILIGLGTIDFVQAVFSGKEDGMKKAQGKFIKRIIIAVIIFLIPTILGLLLDIANNIWGNFGSDICGILF